MRIFGDYAGGMPRDIYPSFAAWMRWQGYAETTVIQYQRITRRWINSHRPPADWLRRVQDQSRARGPAGRGALPTTSAKVYEKALRAYHLFRGVDPSVVTLPRVVRYRRPVEPKVLTRAEEARLRAVLATSAVPEPHRTVITTMMDTGLRISEACGLKLGQVRVQQGQVVLDVDGKGGKRRVVPLPWRAAADLQLYLRGWRAHRRGAWLFPSAQGKARRPISAATVRRALAVVAQRVDADGVRPHDLRRTVATRMAENGVDQRIAAAVLGHSSERQTAAYQHPGVEVMRGALERVAG